MPVLDDAGGGSRVPKRLVVCCDGTWNRPDQISDGVAAPTNVLKVALAVARRAEDGVVQELHYQPGVGTRRLERIRGGAFGLGLSRNVRDCYRFLVEHYEPGDELYFFGFSRGAFTARSLAGLVRNAGILERRHADRIEDAYRLYRRKDKDSEPAGMASAIFRRMYSHPEADIHFVGVWDTVGSLGIPIDGVRLPFVTRLWSFHDTRLSSRIRNAFHALAIDERRGPFAPTLWRRQPHAPPEQRLEQIWFSGVHCDVGGGYADPALSEIALLWMVDRARECGLGFEPDRFRRAAGGADSAERHSGAEVAPDALGKIHESRKGFYRLLPEHRRRLAVDGAAAASSAVRRRRELAGYDPENLDAFLAEGGREVEVTDGG